MRFGSMVRASTKRRSNVPEGALIVVGCGDVYVIVRPLERTQLGTEAPIRIVEHRGSLVIEMV